MDFLRQQVLSRTALSQNQHRRICRRHAVRHFERAPHLGRAADHLAELPFGGKPAAQRIVFFFKDRELQQVRHALPQLFQFETLHQVVRSAKLQRFDCRLRGVQRRNH